MTEKTDVLTVSDVEKLISKFSYKPNFEFTVEHWTQEWGYAFSGEQFSIRVTMWTLDARQTYPLARQFIATTTRAMFGIGSVITYPTENGSIIVDLEPSKAGRIVAVPEWILQSEKHFWDWLRDIITELEYHEIDEWFKVDGTPLHDPHKTPVESGH